MFLTKGVADKHHLLPHCETILLGSQQKYRTTADSVIQDENEGKLKLKYNFPKPQKIDRELASLCLPGCPLPDVVSPFFLERFAVGNLQAGTLNVKGESVEVSGVWECEISLPNSLMFCMSITDDRTSPIYDLQWNIDFDDAPAFGLALERAIRENLPLNEIVSTPALSFLDFLRTVSGYEDSNFDVKVYSNVVEYQAPAEFELNEIDGSTPTKLSEEWVRSAFNKTPEYKNDREYRFLAVVNVAGWPVPIHESQHFVSSEKFLDFILP